MLSYLFFWTRIYLLNFDTMWALPALAFVLLLALRLLLGGKQPCKGLLFIMPALYVVLGFVNAWALRRRQYRADRPDERAG